MSDAPTPGTPDAAEPAPGPAEPGPKRMPSSQPILLRALKWGIIATLVLLVVFGGIGSLVAGAPGLVGGAMGAAFSGLFLALTVGSIAFANRFIESELYIPMFFGIVLGTWVLKFVAFIVALILLRDQTWLNPQMFFFGLIAGVLVSLAIDALVVAKGRMG